MDHQTFAFIKRIRELRKISGGSLNCGWMCDEIVFLLYSLVKAYKPELVIQTGHLWGKSICIVLEALTDGFLMNGYSIEDQEQNGDLKFSKFLKKNKPFFTKCKVISIDPNPSGVPHIEESIRYLISHYDNFEFKKMKSSEFFDKYRNQLSVDFKGKRILGIIDGDHSAYGCIRDLYDLDSIGAGLILVDDTIWLPHIGKIARLFAKRKKYDFLNLSLYNGVGILYKKPIITIGTSSLLDKIIYWLWFFGVELNLLYTTVRFLRKIKSIIKKYF
jgi:hypothetical protein